MEVCAKKLSLLCVSSEFLGLPNGRKIRNFQMAAISPQVSDSKRA